MTETGLQPEASPLDPAPVAPERDLFSKFDALIAERQALLDTGVRDPFGIVMEEVRSPTEAVIKGRDTILLGTYNYMGMTFDADVIAAGKQALDRFGSGTNGSRMLNGTFRDHVDAEDALREFYGADHAMVFSTGYQANLGTISTIAARGEYVILDADSHASIYDGCKMGDAEVVRFRHNSVEDLDKRLGRLPKEPGKLVVLEGVYSMLGDIAPLKEMVAVAKKHGAMVLVDEAHSMGFFGTHGRGVYEDQGLVLGEDVDFVIGTFSKSVGTVGGFCVSNHPKFEAMRLACRPYIFTASLPPSVVATAATSTTAIERPRCCTRLRKVMVCAASAGRTKAVSILLVRSCPVAPSADIAANSAPVIRMPPWMFPIPLAAYGFGGSSITPGSSSRTASAARSDVSGPGGVASM